MSQLDRVALKAYFETGDKPTEAQFIDLIDSCFNLINNADSITHFKKTLIPSADVLDIFDTPIEIIPSPGSNKFIQIITAAIFLDYQTIPYDTNINIYLQTQTASLPQFYLDGVLGSVGSTYSILRPYLSTVFPFSQFVTDKSVIIRTSSGNPQSGNSDITIYVSYKITEL